MIRAVTLAFTLVLSGPVLGQGDDAPDPAPSAGLDESAPALHAMLDAMEVYRLLSIVAEENVASAPALEASLFPGRGGAEWVALMAELHTPERLSMLFEEGFPQDAMTPGQVAEVTEFMTSDLGRRLVAGEIEARVDFMDEDRVDMASAELADAMEADDDRLPILYEFNEVNGFIDRNVTGALNLRFALLRGLVDGGAFDDDMGEDLMLEQVWSQQDEIYRTTVEWLFSYQLAAYRDISDAELRAYVAFGETNAGRAVNAALFTAFDEMLGTLSYEIGRAAAGFIAVEDI
ncbi:hypothetical protein [Hasllibacter sp. MH4015]|uniref:hypothetical protein n=1 Tax=Hasllibacter sp. MH4015 TaxID=2854029 RepID=UPI001CD743E2|nr:hypothetical protein [Hasllibacter sp. MH4015]